MTTLVHKFVSQVPEALEDGVVYVSIPFSTVIHKCCCGCGHEVVTPLSRKTGWQLTFDGESISLHPSIGNRSLPCRSHYWIERNQVVWAGWRDEPRAKNTRRTREADARHARTNGDTAADTGLQAEQGAPARTLWGSLRRWLHRD